VTAAVVQGGEERLRPRLDIVASHDAPHAPHACCPFVWVKADGVADGRF
jgi:hypothetical protein